MGKPSRKPKTLSERMRDAVLASGRTLYRVAKDSGVSYAALYRFVHHRRGLGTEGMDKLYAYLEREELI